MPIKWQTPEAKERLFIAVVAACDPKLDYHRIASFYGEGATYDSIEGQFRKIRKGAIALRASVEAGDIPPAPPRGGGNNTNNHTNSNKSNNTTPRKNNLAHREKTIGGRVTKNSPAKNRGAGAGGKVVKEENESSSAGSFFGGNGGGGGSEIGSGGVDEWQAGLGDGFAAGEEGYGFCFQDGGMGEGV